MNKTTLFTLLLATSLSSPAFAFDKNDAQKIYDERIKSWAQSPEIIDAVKAQNEVTGSYDQAKIDELDQKWQADDASVIDPVLNNATSTALKKIVEDGASYYAEIFVMDGKGLNVGASSKTSDYWQGDEDKWQKTYGTGVGSVDFSDIKFDESTQAYTRQLSFPLMDGDAVVGAVTVSINADFLPE